MPRDLNSYRLVNTAALGARYHTPNLCNQPYSGNQMFVLKDLMYATPYVFPEGGTVRALWCDGMSVAAHKLALYYNTTDGDLYPGAILADFGESVVPNRPLTGSVVLPNPGLYWHVAMRPTDSTPTAHYALRGGIVGAPATSSWLGVSSDMLTGYCAFTAPRNYASGFPPGYPLGATRVAEAPASAIQVGV